MNIIIGMAGAGTRSSKKQAMIYLPLVRVGGTTMIQSAVESLDIDGTYIFVVQQEHMTNYPWLEEHLKSFAETVNIVILDPVTEGALCSLLKAKEFINNDEP